MYGEEYFAKRDVDYSEWLDIELGLRAGGARKSDRIVEIGAGTGGLFAWLRQRGWRVYPCDPYAPKMPGCALPYDIPPADVYIFQHVLEHVEDVERSVEMLSKAEIVVGILPGHLSDDPTHVYNFFTLQKFEVAEGAFGRVRVYPIEKLAEQFRRAGFYVAYAPDMRSLYAPWDLDWLFVASKRKRLVLLRSLFLKILPRLLPAPRRA